MSCLQYIICANVCDIQLLTATTILASFELPLPDARSHHDETALQSHIGELLRLLSVLMITGLEIRGELPKMERAVWVVLLGNSHGADRAGNIMLGRRMRARSDRS